MYTFNLKLLEELLNRHVLLRVLLHNFSHGHLEIFLSNVDSALSQGVHSGLSADALDLSAGRARHRLRDLLQVDSARQIHLPRVNLEDVCSRLLVRWRKFNLAVDAAGAQKRRVEDVDSIGRHNDLNVLRGLEAVELIEKLQHGTLDFGVAAAASAAFNATRADRVDFVHEDDAGRVFASHDEQFADHSRTFADELLHEFRSGDADERALGVVGDGARQKRLPRTRRPVEQNALGLSDAQRVKELRVLHGQLDDLLDLLNLLVEAADHFVGRIRHLFDHHETDERVDLVGQNLVERVRVVSKRHATIRRHVVDVDVLVDVDDEFSFRMNFDEDFLLVHRLHDFSDVGT